MINVWSYLEDFAREREEILATVDRVFSSGQLILGKEVAEFEAQFATFIGADHCVSLDNGTNALALALRAAGVQPGGEVVTVANTAAPTAVAITQVGATPVFVDVNDHYLMDVSQVESALTPRTQALIPVHLYGQCVALESLESIAQSRGLPIIEDCAQAHGATRSGRKAGAMGTFGAFSFYPTKVLGAFGDGGAITTNQLTGADHLRRLRYYGMADRYYVEESPGFNCRLDEVQAALLLHQLKRLDSRIARRQEVALRYHEGLADSGLILPKVLPENSHVYYLYVVRHPSRDAIISRCLGRGLKLNISYKWPKSGDGIGNVLIIHCLG